VRCFDFVLLFTCIVLCWFIRYYNLFKIVHVVSSVKFMFIIFQRLLTEDRRQHLRAEAEVRPQTSPYRIYVGQSAVGQDRFLSGYFGFSLSVSFQQCSMIIHSLRTLQNAGNRQRSYITYLTNTVKVENCSSIPTRSTDNQLISTTRTNCCIYTVYLLMMDLRYAWNMQRLTDEINWG
jgi:hypothetical protein